MITSERGAVAANSRGSSGVPEPPTFVARLAYALVAAVVRPFWGPAFQGLERVPASGRVIIACNHRHWMDTMVMPLCVMRVRFPRLLGKEELFRNPAVGWLIRQLGVIRLDRRRGDVWALKQALGVLETEGCLIVFPEGTRSRTGAPLKPKPGVGFLAAKSGASVVPVRVRHTELFPKPVRMTVSFGEPLRYTGDGGRESCQAFAERVMETIYKL